MVHFGNDWDEILKEEFEKEYYLKLREFLKFEYAAGEVYPPMGDIFNALRYCSFEDTKVVILGQDPYHEPGQAHGLAFSVKKGTDIPPSLKNIYKEIESDLNRKPLPVLTSEKGETGPGDLSVWAKQGVLLLNATLTVRAHQAMSHKGKGWEEFTDGVVKKLNEKEKPVVFILWGNNAREKKNLITNPNHLILEGAHPSPLSASRGFFGGKYFSKANAYLKIVEQQEIVW